MGRLLTVRHFLLPTAPMTACGFHVAAIEGPAPHRRVGSTGPLSGDRGMVEDGTPADRAGITVELVRDTEGLRADVAGLDLCADCAAQLARLVHAPFWRRLLAPRAPAPAPSAPASSALAAPPGRRASTPAMGVKAPKGTP